MAMDRWETAYLALSAFVGEPLETVIASLVDGAGNPADLPSFAVASSDKDVRAAAVARALAEVSIGLDGLRLE
jgi:hypothetical protein